MFFTESLFMKSKLELQQLSLNLVAKHYNPARITPDFLIASGIIPQDWELASKPMVAQNKVQFRFKNSLNIVAQPGRITFNEVINPDGLDKMEVAKVARRYVESLPAANYQLLQISPVSIYNLGEESDAVRQLIIDALLAPSPWHSFGSTPVKAEINLLYQLKHCKLNLKVDEVRLQKGEDTTIAALLFAGDFDYSLVNMNKETKLENLCQVIDNWQQDVSLFQDKISKNVIKTAQAAVSEQPEILNQLEAEKVLH